MQDLTNNNPYTSPASASEAARPRRALWQPGSRPVLLLVPVLWFMFVVAFSAYADNLRYATTISALVIHSAIVGTGAMVSIACLILALRRWWHHLIALPLWFFLVVELLILTLQLAVIMLGLKVR